MYLVSSKIGKLSIWFIVCIGILVSCIQTNPEPNAEPAAMSLSGRPLYAPEPDSSVLQKLKVHEENYKQDSTTIDHIIWYGRFLSYANDFKRAIEIYSRGISQFPDEPKLYRHRGHRYITLRGC